MLIDDYGYGGLIMSNDLFALICEYLASTLNYGIVALALVEFWYFLRAVISLKTLKKDVMHLEEKKEKKIFGKQGRKRAEEEGTYIREWNYEKYDLVMKHYPKTESKYTRFNQVIQLFPLLGILGTVAGLYESVDGISSGDISGVSFALSSTVLG